LNGVPHESEEKSEETNDTSASPVTAPQSNRGGRGRGRRNNNASRKSRPQTDTSEPLSDQQLTEANEEEPSLTESQERRQSVKKQFKYYEKTKKKTPASSTSTTTTTTTTSSSAEDEIQHKPEHTDYSTLHATIIEKLNNKSYECMICTDTIRSQVVIWSCTNCYSLFHLFCIKKWSKSLEEGKSEHVLILIW
jgi:transcriptional repressor NF-X1